MTDREDRKTSQRLPVNPRRHKVAPEQRKRVATACNSCNVRRIKCSGETPCKQCRSSSRDCVYPAPVEKVSVSRSELDDLKRQLDSFDKALQDVVPDPAMRRELLLRVAPADSPASPSGSIALSQWQSNDGDTLSAASVKSESIEDDQTVAAEGRLLRDAVGNVRFFGETNGDVFVDALKECFGSSLQPSTAGSFLTNAGAYQTSDSRAIETSDVDPLWLPSAAHIGVVLAELRHFIQDGGGQWASGGLYWWGDLSSLPMSPMVSGLETPDLRQYRHLAFYHAALAVACRATINKGPASDSEPPLCETYFARAAMLIANPLDVSQYTFGDAATMALMGFYLIETNRIDAAYMYVGSAMRISILQGAHRGLVDEGGKRVFWTIYTLDRWLASLTGRPVTVPVEAIHLQLPLDAPGMPAAAGLRAHVELCRISDFIMNNIHHVSSQSGRTSASTRNLDKALSMLEQWRQTLPADLSLTREGLSQDPAVCTLHMLHNQFLMLATRPWLLAAVRERLTSNDDLQTQTPYLKICMAAARHSVRLGRHLLVINQPRKVLHSGLHFFLNAAICILLQELLYGRGMPQDELSTGRRMVGFVAEGFEGEARMGNDYARDGTRTLRELRLLVARLTLMGGSQVMQTDASHSLFGVGGAEGMTSGSPGPGGDSLVYDYLLAMVGEDWNANNANGT